MGADQPTLFGPPPPARRVEEMTFAQARGFHLPFGKFRGWTVDKVAETDEGLRYLDWMSGQDWLHGDTRRALAAYLGDPAIAGELEKLLERRTT